MRNPGYKLHLPARVPTVYGIDNKLDGRLAALIGALATKHRRFWEVGPKNIVASAAIATTRARSYRPRQTIQMAGVRYWLLIEQNRRNLSEGIFLLIENDGQRWNVIGAEERSIDPDNKGRIEIDMSTLPEEK